MNSSVIIPRLPVILLGLVIIVVSFVDWSRDLQSWMMVPREITASWDQVHAGAAIQDHALTFLTTLSAAFLHGDFSHLIGNMLIFWIFGVVVTELCGGRWFIPVFLLTAIGGSIGQILLNPNSPIPTLGASGGVLGIEGFYFGLAFQPPRQDCTVWPLARTVNSSELITFAILGVILDFVGVFDSGQGIAYGAHLGGFATGILLSLIANPFVRGYHE